VAKPKIVKHDSEMSRPVGRPRSEVSRRSLLKSTFELLKKKPVSEISTADIVREAGVSTATIYRWCSSKGELLLEAFLYKTESVIVLTSDGSALERLKDCVLQISRFMVGESGIAVARVLAAIQDDRDLRICLKTMQYVARVDVRKQCKSCFRLKCDAVRSLWTIIVTS
jgi:AcrR family transcriptional regulator